MRIHDVKEKWFGKIEFEGITYILTDKPVIGGIAKSLKQDAFSHKGAFYKIDDYIWKEGIDTSYIGEDGDPCGLHDSFSGNKFIYYKPREKKKRS